MAERPSPSLPSSTDGAESSPSWQAVGPVFAVQGVETSGTTSEINVAEASVELSAEGMTQGERDVEMLPETETSTSGAQLISNTQENEARSVVVTASPIVTRTVPDVTISTHPPTPPPVVSPLLSASGAVAKALPDLLMSKAVELGECSGGVEKLPTQSSVSSGEVRSGTESCFVALPEQLVATEQTDTDEDLVATVSRELCDFCLNKQSTAAQMTAAGSSGGVVAEGSRSSALRNVRHYCLHPRRRAPGDLHQPSLECLSDKALKHIMSYMTLDDLCYNVQLLSFRMFLLANSKEVLKERLYTVRESLPTSGSEVIKFITRFPSLPGFLFVVPVEPSLLSQLAERARNLKRLEFSAGQNLSTPEMMELFKQNPGVRVLVLPSHAMDDVEVVRRLMAYEQHLENLYVIVGREERWSRLPLTLLAHFSCLTMISIPHLCCNFDDVKYFLEQKCHDLSALEISWKPDRTVDFSVIKLLGICTNLQRLVVVDCNVGSDIDACFRTLEGLKILKELRFRQLSGVNSRILINFFSHTEFLDLERLEIANVDALTDTVAKVIINRFKKLIELRLQDSNVLTGVGLSELHTLPALRILSLAGTAQLCDEALSHISKCKTLQELDISYCGLMGGTSFELLGSLKNLRHLRAKACDLRGKLVSSLMDMSGTRSVTFDLCYGIDLQSAKLLKRYKPWLWRNPVVKAHERGYYNERFGQVTEDITEDVQQVANRNEL